jgi:ribosomal protein S18 acetylase RimI-like enzyme
MQIRRLGPSDASAYRTLRLRALIDDARDGGLELLVLTVTQAEGSALRLYERSGFRSFGIEPRAIKVDGRAYAKNHMYLEL